ncbi:MAG: homocysteine S-methyltransferase family protein, partial [Armatimonadota bacterium]|nr:homocysteine S-methyltransferase family protein [Armatimonadota bacterium]
MNTSQTIKALLEQRILIIDGAMGTMIQRYRPDEQAYRGARFADHPIDLKNNNDLLSITQPQMIREIHRAYLDAGADIIETNTFSSNSKSMADYGMESLVYELNVEGARLAREAVEEAMVRDPSHPRFVAGSLGPTTRTASIVRDLNHPAYRPDTFDEFVAAYYEQVRGLMEGGVDLLLAETTFDTLVLKAALFAIEQYFQDTGKRVPVMASM